MTEDLGLMQLMYGIAHAFSSRLDRASTSQAVLHAIQESLDVRAVVIRLLNADELVVAASMGVNDQFLQNVHTKIVAGSVHEQVLDGKTVHVENLVAQAGDPVQHSPPVERRTTTHGAGGWLRGASTGGARARRRRLPQS